MTEKLSVPQGEFRLIRLPERRQELLRAWDAADEYLLNAFATDLGLPPTARVLIINDSFGALATALADSRPQAWTDSYLSQQATRINLQANGFEAGTVKLWDSLQTPTGPFEVVLIKAPKTLAFLEDLLLRLRPQLTAETQVIVAGMVKHLPTSVWALLERLIGPTTTSLAKKKARLIFAKPDPRLSVPVNPYPSVYTLENTAYQITNHANVFSREQLDIGTRFFLQHLPAQLAAQDIVDLGCGNGVVGLIVAERNPQASLHFFDESFMAVASARRNFIAAFGSNRSASFNVENGLDAVTPASFDMVLCNPPFHQQQTIGNQLALSLFRQAHKALRKKGELWVVGNRHLGYQDNLHQLFGNFSMIANNAKFVIIKAIKK